MCPHALHGKISNVSHVAFGVESSYSCTTTFSVLGVVVKVGNEKVVAKASFIVRGCSLKLAFVIDHAHDFLEELGIPPNLFVVFETIDAIL